MGFLQDMRDLQQQADGIVAPKDARYLELHAHENVTKADAVRCTDLVDDDGGGKARPTG
jgi:hypothetical protein